MKKSLLIPIPVLALGLAVLAPAARADLTMEMKQTMAKGKEVTETVRVTEHKIGIDSGGQGMVFRGDKKVLWIIDTAQKTYTEMDEAAAKAMGEQMNSAMAQLQEAMKGMPAEQRAQMEKMMAGKMKGMTPPKQTVKPMGQTKPINGFECAGYTVSGGDGETEVWAADPKVLKLGTADMTAFKDFAEFMKSSFPGMERIADLAKDFDHPREDQVPGFPVLTIRRDKSGKEEFRSELLKLTRGSVDASVFELPAGLTKTDMPGLMKKK
jgi:hypothetical protein